MGQPCHQNISYFLECRKRDEKERIEKGCQIFYLKCTLCHCLFLCMIGSVFCVVFWQNKKQRQVVREAVLRMKDPQQILLEIEEIEKVEGELGTAPLPNEKGLQEKKRKLHAQLHRVVSYYVS